MTFDDFFLRFVGFAMFLANAFISMFMYLKQKPLPAITMVTTLSETKVQSGSQKAMVTQSIEKTTLSGCSPAS